MAGFSYSEELALDQHKLERSRLGEKLISDLNGTKSEQSETFGIYLKK